MNTTNKSLSNKPALGWVALAAAPAFFASNIIFGRAANTIDPFTLALLRWAISALILLFIIKPHWGEASQLARAHWKLLTLSGFLAMWVCGGLVYLALKHTTATNGTLIYTTPPLIIILIEFFLRGRPIKTRELIGIVAAMLGIGAIITNGNPTTILQLQFNRGDMMFLLAAFSWAIYTLLLRAHAFDGNPTRVIFALTALFGSATLLPVAIWELSNLAHYPQTMGDWRTVGGLVLFSSLIPFSLYQFGNRQHGPAAASVFMYLLPPFGLGMAWLFLGEIPNGVTLLGCLFVLGGVIIATLPMNFLRR